MESDHLIAADPSTNPHRALHLINGSPADKISVSDRGLLYGDGVFRTLRVLDGKIRCWHRHYRKLQHDCAALGITCPEVALLFDELQQLTVQQPDGVAKIIITRGQQMARGYAPTSKTLTRILSMTAVSHYPAHFYTQGIRLHVCQLRLGHQAQLAGIKHLNRLENVLASGEWQETDSAEGLLLDIAGNVVEGTRTNLFMVRNGELLTPDLSRCGVAGIQRDRVIEWAVEQGMPCQVAHFSLTKLLEADEVFLVNSLIGLWPVRELQGRIWHKHPISLQVQEWFNHAPD